MSDSTTPNPALAEVLSVLLEQPAGYEKWISALARLPKNTADVQAYCRALADKSYAVGISENAVIEIAIAALSLSAVNPEPGNITGPIRSIYKFRNTQSSG